MPAPLGLRSRRGFQELSAPSGGAPTIFDPTTLAASGYWRASYTGAPWAAVATAGTSLANGNLAAGVAPGVGAAVNGKTPATFDGSTQYLDNATDATVLYSASGSGIIALVQVNGSVAPSGSTYDDAAIAIDGNADYGLTSTTSGITAMVYSGGYVTRTVATTAGFHLIMMRHDGVLLGLTKDSAAEDTIAAGALTVFTGPLYVGRGYAGGKWFNGEILELMTFNSYPSNGNYSDFKSYVNATYGLVL